MTSLIVQLRHAKRNQAAHLDLSNRIITFIPKELYSLPYLTSLNLSHNKISHIEPSINQLSMLSSLILNNNELSDLPREILDLEMLTTLEINNNPLTEQFVPLLAVGTNGTLRQVLKGCFKVAGNSLANTPSWLTESHSKKAFKMQPFRRDNNGESKKYEPLRRLSLKPKSNSQTQAAKEQVMGTLLIRTSQITQQKEISTVNGKTISAGIYCGLPVSVIKTAALEPKQGFLHEFQNQVNVLCKYRHPYILLLIGAVPSPHCWIVTEQVRGSLEDQLRRGLTDQEKSTIVNELLLALSHLHHHGVVHRNICPSSFLIDNAGHVKLAGFGQSLHQSQSNRHKVAISRLPNAYRAPELQNSPNSLQTDIFDLGTMLYEIYCGESSNNLPGQLMQKNTQKLQLINRCRRVQPSERPNCSQLLKFGQW